MNFNKIKIAVATPTRETAFDYLKSILDGEYVNENANITNSLIYETNLIQVFWVEEFSAPLISRRYNYICCRPAALNSVWFDRYFAPLGTRGFGLIEEESNE